MHQQLVLLPEVDADEGVEAVQELLQGRDVLLVRLGELGDPGADREVVVGERAVASGEPMRDSARG